MTNTQESIEIDATARETQRAVLPFLFPQWIAALVGLLLAVGFYVLSQQLSQDGVGRWFDWRLAAGHAFFLVACAQLIADFFTLQRREREVCNSKTIVPWSEAGYQAVMKQIPFGQPPSEVTKRIEVFGNYMGERLVSRWSNYYVGACAVPVLALVLAFLAFNGSNLVESLRPLTVATIQTLVVVLLTWFCHSKGNRVLSEWANQANLRNSKDSRYEYQGIIETAPVKTKVEQPSTSPVSHGPQGNGEVDNGAVGNTGRMGQEPVQEVQNNKLAEVEDDPYAGWSIVQEDPQPVAPEPAPARRPIVNDPVLEKRATNPVPPRPTQAPMDGGYDDV